MRYLRWLCRAARPYGFPLTMIMLCHVAVAACSIGFVYSCKKLVDCAVDAFNSIGTSEGTLWHLNISKELIWPIILVLFGLFLLADALRKPKNSKFHIFTSVL